jgi:Zn-dependent M28 family amino/carboxypeptidase
MGRNFYFAIFFVVVSHLCPLPATPAGDVALVQRHVEALASIQPPRNHRNLASLEKAVKYINRELQPFTKMIRAQDYQVDNRIYRNLVANIGPQDAEIIVIGAHYDVCGDQPGADDNASGVAGLLLLAKHLSANKAALRYNYELVFYSLEEPPYFRTKFMGSAVHARSLKDKGARVKYMLSLETIGYYSDKKGSQRYPAGLSLFYPSEGNFIAAVGRQADGDLLSSLKKNFQKHSPLKIITLAAPSFITGVDFSDHLNYWAQGWNAAMVTDTAFMRNRNYHEASDTPDTLDYEKMAQVIRGVYGAVTATDL